MYTLPRDEHHKLAERFYSIFARILFKALASRLLIPPLLLACINLFPDVYCFLLLKYFEYYQWLKWTKIQYGMQNSPRVGVIFGNPMPIG